MIVARIKSRLPRSGATFVPFPLSRRRPLIAKLAREMAAVRTAELAERALQSRAARLARALRNQHFPEALIERELRAFEFAVRAELWHILFAPRSRR